MRFLCLSQTSRLHLLIFNGEVDETHEEEQEKGSPIDNPEVVHAHEGGRPVYGLLLLLHHLLFLRGGVLGQRIVLPLGDFSTHCCC